MTGHISRRYGPLPTHEGVQIHFELRHNSARSFLPTYGCFLPVGSVDFLKLFPWRSDIIYLFV